MPVRKLSRSRSRGRNSSRSRRFWKRFIGPRNRCQRKARADGVLDPTPSPTGFKQLDRPHRQFPEICLGVLCEQIEQCCGSAVSQTQQSQVRVKRPLSRAETPVRRSWRGFQPGRQNEKRLCVCHSDPDNGGSAGLRKRPQPEQRCLEAVCESRLRRIADSIDETRSSAVSPRNFSVMCQFWVGSGFGPSPTRSPVRASRSSLGFSGTRQAMNSLDMGNAEPRDWF